MDKNMDKNIAVFLDRDGVINEDTGYVYKIEDFKVIPGVMDALRRLQSKGFKLMIVTNQAGIAKGYYTLQDFQNLNSYMLGLFEKESIKIDKVYFCPHGSGDNCECRKPKIKFIKEAEKEFNLDLEKCWAIGDKMSDIEMGENAGCKTILIDSRYVQDVSLKNTPKLKNLYGAVEYIEIFDNYGAGL